ncbi:Protein kinase-like domain protein [Niveomyces insectorum RCEF 264]|uniref:Protein kinase-like domain protein n=1 Tax=Niveomyces insectorum RCEF 264 TaxID=1081102 RepID=A0A167VGT0_9HYPO|nr:Protein kinase-like domain protein [Niveomyces insectorum RCEF 264]
MDTSIPTFLLRYVPDDLHLDDVYQSEEYAAWEKLTAPENDGLLEEFVTGLLNGKRGRATRVGPTYPGSCNVVVRFCFPDAGPDVALRFPKPGAQTATAAALLDEKTVNEARWMQYLRARTTIPIPEVYVYGTAAEGLPYMGPFILMEWMAGENLYAYLVSRPPSLKLDDIFTQVAGFLWELYHLRLDKIGSVSEAAEGGLWSVTGRPLTWDMQQMFCDNPTLSTDAWPTGPLHSGRAYFHFVSRHQHSLLWAVRNLNVPCRYDAETNQSVQADHESALDRDAVERIARCRFKARRGFTALVDQFYPDDEYDSLCDCPFVPYNLDLGPRNMLIDRTTGRITGVIDWEYTNAMPAQFACDPPLWLALILPRACLQSDSFSSFRKHYPPYLERFLAAVKRVENQKTTAKTTSEPSTRTQTGAVREEHPSLSERMRQSWQSKRCWFDFAANYSDQVDGIYEAELRGISRGAVSSRPEEEDEYAKFAVEQSVAYVREVGRREYGDGAATG